MSAPHRLTALVVSFGCSLLVIPVAAAGQGRLFVHLAAGSSRIRAEEVRVQGATASGLEIAGLDTAALHFEWQRTERFGIEAGLRRLAFDARLSPSGEHSEEILDLTAIDLGVPLTIYGKTWARLAVIPRLEWSPEGDTLRLRTSTGRLITTYSPDTLSPSLSLRATVPSCGDRGALALEAELGAHRLSLESSDPAFDDLSFTAFSLQIGLRLRLH